MSFVKFMWRWTGFLIGLGALFFVVMALAAPFGWPFELFFSWPYLVAAIGLTGAIAFGLSGWGRMGTVTLVGVLIVVGLAIASPGDLSRAKAPPLTQGSDKLIWGNVLGFQANIKTLMERADANKGAVLAVGEVPRLWRWEPIDARKDLAVVRTGGIAIEGCEAEQMPFRNSGYYGGQNRQRTYAIKVKCPNYTLFAVHLTNPLWEMGLRFMRRGEELEVLARAIKAETGPIVVIGDFNTPPNALPFSRFIKQANVSHTSCGGRWLPTWRPYGWRTKFKDGNPLTGVPIDHLFTRDIDVLSCTVGTDFGSDHLPLVVELKKSAQITTQSAP